MGVIQPSVSLKKKSVETMFRVLFRSGIDRVIRRVQTDTLTVINYHRIDDPFAVDFFSFKPNVSATPPEFARQLDYLKSRFNLVTARQILASLRGESSLPANPALITFDDGYLDNLTNAYPLLRARNLSALIFLTTHFIDRAQMPYWDLAAYCFKHTRKDTVHLPVLGSVHWTGEREKERILLQWVERIKTLPGAEKDRAVDQLPALLDVCVCEEDLRSLFLTWQQVREMTAGGVEFGAHTVSHPILSRVSSDQMERELVDSRYVIEQQLGKEVVTFAYPNGQAADYSPEIVQAVQRVGYQLAFTLVNGFNPISRLTRDRLTLRRIFIHYRDTLPRFAARVNGYYH